MMIITTAQIVLQCQKLGALSSNQAGLLDSDVLFYANLIAADVLVEILRTREEYLIFRDRLLVTAGNVRPMKMIASG